MCLGNLRVAAVLSVWTLLSASAQAGTIAITFSGVLDSVQDINGDLDASVVPGAAFSGSFSYDPALAVDEFSDPFLGQYHTPSPFEFTVASMALEAPGHQIRIFSQQGNEPAGGEFGGNPHATSIPPAPWDVSAFSVAEGAFLSASLDVQHVFMALQDTDFNAFPDDSLPTILDLNEFDSYRTFRLLANDDNVNVAGEVTSLTIVPEPATSALMVIGAMFIVGRRPKTQA